ncbi:MAG: iron ABC transporter permease [Campylobacter sputorum]|uniref:FecCD family ABC transporter permease n=1 Tax=Campylobacter sputorum TaxID=206 RepID=UPI000B76DB15|nr:iron ABC transporter permease [Campylobacter sputorum]ASM37671.1 metal ion ABC transporter, permease protein [Campylobacter sputorum bv. paraureolyticus LMG 11764]MDY6120205.1 iron ABC transporter permease [Campylobacter sputorum]
MIFRLNLIAFLFVILLVISIISLVAGSYDIDAKTVFEVLAHKILGFNSTNLTKMDIVIIHDIRLPRVITAILVGFALSVAGAVYQACFRNPLVEPFILGASSGAAFGAAIAIVLANSFITISMSAFVFSVMAVFIAYILARTNEGTPVVGLILSGVIIGSIFSALVSVLKYVSDDNALREITFWIMGGIYYANWDGLWRFALIIMAIFVIIFLFSYRLNLLSLGDKEAKSLGILPERNKVVFILLATLLTSLSVANVGIIAWIGLMMPHAARLIVGADNRYVIVTSALMGAIYLLICDTLARTIAVSEIPVGIITSIVGAPFLIWLLRSKKKELMR